MKRFFCASLLLVSLAAGCTKTADPAATNGANPNAGQAGNNVSPVVTLNPGTVHGQPGVNPAATIDLKNVGPEVVVDQFLRALQQGNRPLVAALLTDMARTETTKFGLEVQPESVPTAAFRIVDAVYLQPEGAPMDTPPEVAHVASLWAEDGGEEAYEIIWVLKHAAHGWRIAAMGLTVDFNKDPLLLDFEHPEEMMKARDQAMQEMAAQEAAAQQPGALQPGQLQPPAQLQPGQQGPGTAQIPQTTQPGVATNPNLAPPTNSPLRTNTPPTYPHTVPGGSSLRPINPQQATQPNAVDNPIRR